MQKTYLLLLIVIGAISAVAETEQLSYLELPTATRLLPDSKAGMLDAFETRTIKCILGNIQGDGTLYEEGGNVSGLALGVFGNQLRFLVRINSRAYDLTTDLDRERTWNSVVANFNRGQLRLFLNGKPAGEFRIKDKYAKKVPAHSDPAAVGGVNGSNSGGWGKSGLRCNLAHFHMSSKNPKYIRSAIASDVSLKQDSNTILLIDPATLDHEQINAKWFPDSRRADLKWRVEGELVLNKYID